MNVEHILTRIDLLILNFKKNPHICCFLGLGSLANQKRLDQYSDIDFFLIVEKGYKTSFMDDLTWLDVYPISYQFRNTKDGYKVMYEDGVFLEFAVFEVHELKNATFSTGNILYKKDGFDEKLVVKELPVKEEVTIDFRVNEALTNLYVGLLRHKRGEIASACSFIQVYAVHQIYELMPMFFNENKDIEKDYFVSERRIEKRFSNGYDLLKPMMQGYDKNIESAEAILNFLMTHSNVSMALATKIKALIKEKKW